MGDSTLTKRDLREVVRLLEARKICPECTPFERARFMGERAAVHQRCAAAECGCCCQAAGRAS